MSPTPAILLSGWAHPARVLCPLAEALRPVYDAICLSTDELGDDPAGWSDALAERIRAAAAPPLLIGWSMGGMVALDAMTAEAPPPPVTALVLIGSTARFCAAPHWPWGQTTATLRALRLGLRRDPRGALAGFFAECDAPARTEEDLLARRIDEARALGEARLSAGLDYLGSTDLADRLDRLHVRLACIHGEDDRVIPCDASRALARKCSGVLEVLAKNGHSAAVASPVQVAGAIRRVLQVS